MAAIDTILLLRPRWRESGLGATSVGSAAGIAVGAVRPELGGRTAGSFFVAAATGSCGGRETACGENTFSGVSAGTEMLLWMPDFDSTTLGAGAAIVLETTGARKRYPRRVSDLLDAVVHPLLEVDVSFFPPELLLDFLAGHDLPGTAGQQGEQTKGLGRQLD